MKPARSFGRDRPLTTIVALDPAYSGDAGLAVGRLDEPLNHARWWSGPVLSTDMSEWLGEVVSELTPPGHRAVLVAEADAFGPSVARKLGIAVGAVESLLLDLNAVVAGTRRDVTTRSWRTALWGKSEAARIAGLGKSGARKAWKAKALEHAAALTSPFRSDGLTHDAAEALALLQVARERYYEAGEVLAMEAR